MALIPEQIIATFTMIFTDNQGTFLLSTLSKPKLISYVREHTGIDMENDSGYSESPSCIKKLRYFMTHEPDDIVGPTIVGIIGYKEGEVSCLEASGKSYPYKTQLAELKTFFSGLGNQAVLRPDARRLGEQVFNELIDAAAVVCCNQTYRTTSTENSINDFIRNLINHRGVFSVKDQTRHGVSLSGLDAGEIDLLLLHGTTEVAIVEGMKVICVESTSIDSHIRKLVTHYNPTSLNSYLLIYYAGSSFDSFNQSFRTHINNYCFPVSAESKVEKIEIDNSAINAYNILLNRDGCNFLLYIMTIRLLE